MVRSYIQACNDGDGAAIAGYFSADAIHHMPTNDRGLVSWRGASEIGARFEALVRASGRSWSVDQLVSDNDRMSASWTSFNKERDRLVRGIDWFDFEPQTPRIKAIRSFVAADSNPEAARVEQQDFDYAGRGYLTL